MVLVRPVCQARLARLVAVAVAAAVQPSSEPAQVMAVAAALRHVAAQAGSVVIMVARALDCCSSIAPVCALSVVTYRVGPAAEAVAPVLAVTAVSVVVGVAVGTGLAPSHVVA